MPSDKRLFMTFPIDFPEHPKVKPLSVLAKWTFVEMNGYSRRQDLDGIIPAAAAEATWPKKVLLELVASHPERPLVTFSDDCYILRDYAEHQETRASIAARKERNQANGAKGGRPRNANPVANRTETQSVTESVTGSEPDMNPTKSRVRDQSQSSEIDETHYYESSHLQNAQVSDSDPNELDQQRAQRAGVNDIAATRLILERTVGSPVSYRGAVELAEAITSKSARHVRDVDAYVATTCRKSPLEVQKAYFDLDIEGVA